MTDKSKASYELNFSWPFPEEKKLFYRFKSMATITFVYSLSRIIFCGLNKLVIHNKKNFIKLLEDTSRPLLTVANHRCNFDDPLVWSMLSFNEFWRNISRFRYTLAAHDICFTKPLHTYLFSLGRCVPCVRGAGIFQTGVDYCIKMMNKENAWIHIFPEGKVTEHSIRIKWGISRLILESSIKPILLPIWINNMREISSTTAPYYPKIGKTVEVIVGEPIDTKLILNSLKGITELEKRKEIADYVQNALFLIEKLNSLKK